MSTRTDTLFPYTTRFRSDPVLQNIHGYLESLAAETGETALLAVREHAAVIYVDVVESSSPIRYSAKVGDRRSLFTASSGKAILTSLAPQERAAILGSDAELANALEVSVRRGGCEDQARTDQAGLGIGRAPV